MYIDTYMHITNSHSYNIQGYQKQSSKQTHPKSGLFMVQEFIAFSIQAK